MATHKTLISTVATGSRLSRTSASEQLLPLLYDELRKLPAAKMAQDAPGQTLQATALVHEAYLRLLGPNTEQAWDNRGHFFASAAEAMRRILVNHARNKNRLKRGGNRKRVDFGKIDVADDQSPEALLYHLTFKD